MALLEVLIYKEGDEWEDIEALLEVFNTRKVISGRIEALLDRGIYIQGRVIDGRILRHF